jgi:hypothetical protein
MFFRATVASSSIRRRSGSPPARSGVVLLDADNFVEASAGELHLVMQNAESGSVERLVGED